MTTNLPATALCPGCGTMVVLPVVPRDTGDDPLICGTCGVEVPDNRRELAASQAQEAARAAREAEVAKRPENQVYTRGSLLKGFRDRMADRALDAVREIGERAKFD
ncbi:MAG TPA: hypothetical protein VGL76_02770 [Gaiellaceae bacterium]